MVFHDILSQFNSSGFSKNPQAYHTIDWSFLRVEVELNLNFIEEGGTSWKNTSKTSPFRGKGASLTITGS